MHEHLHNSGEKKIKMTFIITLFAAFAFHQPPAKIQVEFVDIEAIYLPEGHAGIIVAAPFEYAVF